MLNLQSKFGQKLMQAGNWLTGLISINLVWFMITLPFWIMLVFWAALPQGIVANLSLIVIFFMGACFLIPVTRAVYLSVKHWMTTDNGLYFKVTWHNFLQCLRQWKFNLLSGVILTIWLACFRLSQQNVFVSTILIGLAIILLMGFISYVFANIQKVSVLRFWLNQPWKLLLSTVILIVALGINLQIRLLFLLFLCSMSFAAWAAVKLIGKQKTMK